MMKISFEQALIEVWRQALLENVKVISLGSESYPVHKTAKRGLRQVDFMLEGTEMRGIEQSPPMASYGKKVMQFLSKGRYIANVVDGKVNFYGRRDV